MHRWTQRTLTGFVVTGAVLATAALGALVDRDAIVATIEFWRAEAPGALLQLLGQLLEAARDIAVRGFARTPETMLAVGAALALPIIGAIAGLLGWFRRRRTTRQSQKAAQARPVQTLPPGPHAKAWLEIAGQAELVMIALAGEICRIGSDRDSDVELHGPALQPAHALIRRTPDAEFLIIDTTGEAGPGITVNGGRFLRCALRDGDRIDLGGAQVTFRRECERHGRGPRTEPPRPSLH